jgi:hypothetical protein
MSALLEQDPLAYALYINAKATCDDYGRIIASPRKFRSIVAPMATLTLKSVEDAINTMVSIYNDAGEPLVRMYESDGEQYMEIVGYNETEDTNWVNISKPQYPRPDDWKPPQTLIDFIMNRCGTDSRITLERYGLSLNDFPAELRDELTSLLNSAQKMRLERAGTGRFVKANNSERNTQTPSGDGETTVGRQQKTCQGGDLDRVEIEVDVESENVLKDSTLPIGNVPTEKRNTQSGMETPKTAPVIRAQSPQQRVGDATLNMFRLTHDSLSKEQCAKYYKAIASVIKSTYLGAEGILEWIAKQPQQTLGEGSDPAISIPAYLRSNFQTYQKHLEFAKERQQRMGESGNSASYGDAGAGGNGNGSKKTPSRQDDILTYWKIRALEDVNDKLPTPDMDTRSRLAGERQRIVVRIGYEPDFDTKPQSA